MRRADRLFRLLQILQRDRFATAKGIAEELEVSARTVYRDVADLQASRVPIEGEAGVGYTLADGFDLPPLMFQVDELEALILGLRVVTSWGDDELGRSAKSVQSKIESVLPRELREAFTEAPLHSHAFFIDARVSFGLSELRLALRERRITWLRYRDRKEVISERLVHPLGISFWGSAWTLTAWCRLRQDFRHFRLDRIQAIELREGRFPEDESRSQSAFLARVREEPWD